MPSREPEPGRTGTPSDSWLVQRAVTRAKEGDPEGLHFLYIRYASDVCGYLASFVHEDHEAEDITQGVFTKLVTAIDEYEQREEPFGAWILRVTRDAALEHMRQADDPHRGGKGRRSGPGSDEL
jgi:DNA-directed RNA polymerase specialized sigma24 family protein